MLTPGKVAGMKAVSDNRGVIAAAAMDQRGSLRKSLAKERGSEISDAMMEEFKVLVTEVLTNYASAILLDPEWGLPASKKRAKGSGLLMAYEKTGYDAATPGRLPDLLNDWSVRRLKEAGADCIKILLYYTPTDPKSINDQKHAWVERIGDECIANDIPFFLELIGYEDGVDEKGIEFAKKKPQIVAESMSEFSKSRYGVDVLKVEVPVNMKFVEGASVCKGPSAYTRDEAKKHFLAAATATNKPFIYLSAGVSNEESPKRSRSPPSPASNTPAFSAGARPGRTASPSTPSRARAPFAPGSSPRASRTSRTSTTPSRRRRRGTRFMG
jgi:tagatose 1,6-diphosphate aldolase